MGKKSLPALMSKKKSKPRVVAGKPVDEYVDPNYYPTRERSYDQSDYEKQRATVPVSGGISSFTLVRALAEESRLLIEDARQDLAYRACQSIGQSNESCQREGLRIIGKWLNYLTSGRVLNG